MSDHITPHPADELLAVPVTAPALRQTLHDLRPCAQQLQRLETGDVLHVLEQLGRMWQPGSAHFQEASALLTGTFSRIAIEGALTNLSTSLNSEAIIPELTRELGRHDLLDTWQADEHGIGHVRGFPLGVVAHVLAGNVFMNGVLGLAQCLLTRNAALLKLSRRDAGLTTLFVRSLKEADRTGIIGSAVQVCNWASSDDTVNQTLRDEADGIVVWGGEQAISAFPPSQCRGRVVAYGPRLGLGFVLAGTELNTELPALAWDIALWEQQACSSPRLVFVEDPDRDGVFPRHVAQELSREL
ncbi:MAG: acyl-CoA reductase, partial [Planctomycetaceae bacterium]